MLNILLVEDNKENQLLVSWIIEDEGHNLSIADTAEQSLELISSNQYDLILMDISLPGMSGKEAARAIRKDPAMQNIPIIAVTAHTTQNELDDINQCGFSAIEHKPVDEARLLKTIYRLTEHQ